MSRTAYVLIFALVLIFVSCIETPDYSAEPVNPYNIELNDGEKWNVDDNMVVYIKSMDRLIRDSKPKSPEDYSSLGQKLMDEVNLLTSSCKMTGKAHDELHKWLLPFIDLVDALQKAKTVESGTEAHKNLKLSMEEYHRYFQ